MKINRAFFEEFLVVEEEDGKIHIFEELKLGDREVSMPKETLTQATQPLIPPKSSEELEASKFLQGQIQKNYLDNTQERLQTAIQDLDRTVKYNKYGRS